MPTDGALSIRDSATDGPMGTGGNVPLGGSGGSVISDGSSGTGGAPSTLDAPILNDAAETGQDTGSTDAEPVDTRPGQTDTRVEAGCGDLMTSPNNCGACGNDCTALPHVVGTAVRCEQGKCVIPATGACDDGWAHCSTDVSEGCETAINTPSNCGGCGTGCSATTPLCSKDGSQSYRCSNSCTAAAPDFCPASNTCSNLQTDSTHCGSCTNGCAVPDNGSASCNAGTCGYSCKSNYHACSTDKSCRADTDATHCGTNCVACAIPDNGSSACNAGTCGYTCKSNYHACSADSSCRADTDATHCGTSCVACTVPDNGSAMCNAGACDVQCSSNYHACSDKTCRRNDDATHCGPSCQACSAPTNGTAICDNGTCGVQCSGSAQLCNGACIDYASSPTNCGACGHSCDSGATCTSGKCSPVRFSPASNNVSSMDANANGVYFSTLDGTSSADSTSLYSCPHTGCGATGGYQIATGYLYTAAVMAGSDTVAFTATTGSPYNRYLYACPITGCPAAPVTLASRDTRSGTILPIGIVGTNAYWAIKYPFDTYVTDLLGGALSGGTPLTISTNSSGWGTVLAVDSTSVYFTDKGTGDIYSCPNGSTCSSPSTVRTAEGPIILRAYGGKLYWTTYRGMYRCTPSSCTPETLLSLVQSISELAVDENGFYWIGPSDGVVYSCPLSGCTGGAAKVGTASSGASNLRVGGSYIYWISSNSIFRLPKL